ncbi:MAG: hypothetical protein ACE141_14500 [Bryobacteraceae bacterium]
MRLFFPVSLVFLTLGVLYAQSCPQAEISNGLVRAGLYLPGGPGFLVRSPFEPRGKLTPDKALELRGRELHFVRELQGQETAMAILEGFKAAAEENDVTIENQTTGACVRITGDWPLDGLRVFFRRPNVCPETFFRLRIGPGQVAQWGTRYLFYRR